MYFTGISFKEYTGSVGFLGQSQTNTRLSQCSEILYEFIFATAHIFRHIANFTFAEKNFPWPLAAFATPIAFIFNCCSFHVLILFGMFNEMRLTLTYKTNQIAYIVE